MAKIKTEIWEPSPDRPGASIYKGQRSALEVFRELEAELESVGLYPDESLSLDEQWRDGKEYPEGAHIMSQVYYGDSEGIWMNLSLKVFDEETRKDKYLPFATGKTLGDMENDLDRMYLAASKITSLIHGGGTYARYIRLGEDASANGMNLHLNESERKLVADSLVEHRNNLLQGVVETEQVLRRITGGNILDYVETVGDRPLHMSPKDKAVLAIHDSDARRFAHNIELIDNEETLGDLLVQAARRTGQVGRQMLDGILEKYQPTDAVVYEEACGAAIKNDSVERVLHLLECADKTLAPPDPGLRGRVMYAATRGSEMSPRIASAILRTCSDEEIRRAPPQLLRNCNTSSYRELAADLIRKGINPNPHVHDYINWCRWYQDEWMVERLFNQCKMEIAPDNYKVMEACLELRELDSAQCLLDQGMDLAKYAEWAEHHRVRIDSGKMEQLWEYARSISEAAQEKHPDEGPAMT